MQIINNTWKFPVNVDFTMAHLCLSKLKNIACDQTIIFDLSKTVEIHSSFIGFLIHARQITNKEGGHIILSISPTLEKTFTMMKIMEYFPGLTVNNLP